MALSRIATAARTWAPGSSFAVRFRLRAAIASRVSSARPATDASNTACRACRNSARNPGSFSHPRRVDSPTPAAFAADTTDFRASRATIALCCRAVSPPSSSASAIGRPDPLETARNR